MPFVKVNVILLIIVILLLGGCSRLDVPKQTSTYALDFRPYSDKGFLFTPEDYNGEYESIGLLSVEQTPEVAYKTRKIYQGELVNKTIGSLDVSEAMDSLYSIATEWEANAIIRFKVDTHNFIVNNEGVIKLTLSGFAIKRINN